MHHIPSFIIPPLMEQNIGHYTGLSINNFEHDILRCTTYHLSLFRF